ncbi:MAG: DUF3298 and DUF4163 domain-containing protein [Candidatus Paceibacterota bacterium]
MKKILIVILLVLFLAFVFFLFKRTTLAPVVSVLPVIEEKNDTDYIEFDLSYPDIPEGKYTEMADFLKTNKEDFINDFGSYSEDEAEFLGLGDYKKYSYFVDTKIATSSNTVSYILQIYNYTGGAHGITNTVTFTYDNEDKLVRLDDVFNTPDYLNVISEKAYKYFVKKLGENGDSVTIKDGTRALVQNYYSWYLDGGNIVFIFNQYAIGPYALGIQEFSLAKSEVPDILNERYK